MKTGVEHAKQQRGAGGTRKRKITTRSKKKKKSKIRVKKISAKKTKQILRQNKRKNHCKKRGNDDDDDNKTIGIKNEIIKSVRSIRTKYNDLKRVKSSEEREREESLKPLVVPVQEKLDRV